VASGHLVSGDQEVYPIPVCDDRLLGVGEKHFAGANLGVKISLDHVLLPRAGCGFVRLPGSPADYEEEHFISLGGPSLAFVAV